jgi:hypothetical protein
MGISESSALNPKSSIHLPRWDNKRLVDGVVQRRRVRGEVPESQCKTAISSDVDCLASRHNRQRDLEADIAMLAQLIATWLTGRVIVHGAELCRYSDRMTWSSCRPC